MSTPQSTEDKDKAFREELDRHLRKEKWELRKGYFFLLLILGGGAYWGSNALDDAGWIPHEHTVDLYMKGNWLDGENRTCTGFQSGQGESVHLTSLSCPGTSALDETPHNMSMKFWGKVSRPEMIRDGLWLSWKCTRTGEGFVCRALN
jgi:hypothetical protein